METENDFTKGLSKNREHMGPRYIEVFASKKSDMEWATRRCGQIKHDSDEPPCEDVFVRLRGLPFSALREEVQQFFSGNAICSQVKNLQVFLKNCSFYNMVDCICYFKVLCKHE